MNRRRFFGVVAAAPVAVVASAPAAVHASIGVLTSVHQEALAPGGPISSLNARLTHPEHWASLQAAGSSRAVLSSNGIWPGSRPRPALARIVYSPPAEPTA